MKFFDSISIPIILLLGLIVAGLLFFLQIPQNLYKEYTLRNTFTGLMGSTLKNDCAGQYNYLLPTEKTDTSLEDFTAELCENNVYSLDTTVNSIEIKGDEGYVNRTIKKCYSETCAGNDLIENTRLTKYFYVNGKWYISQKETMMLCTRMQPYPMLPEFQRALSLIKERLENSQNFQSQSMDDAFVLKKIYNCLNVQYASTDEELNGAEGIFKFDNTSTAENLKIFVSPKYQVKDDLLTAILLRHEVAHADYYATGYDKKLSCYENEAYAFAKEIGFLRASLNDEEKKSIESRYNSSQEARDLIDLNNTILSYGGNYISDGTLLYVKQNPFYQTQCAGEN